MVEIVYENEHNMTRFIARTWNAWHSIFLMWILWVNPSRFRVLQNALVVELSLLEITKNSFGFIETNNCHSHYILQFHIVFINYHCNLYYPWHHVQFLYSLLFHSFRFCIAMIVSISFSLSLFRLLLLFFSFSLCYPCRIHDCLCRLCWWLLLHNNVIAAIVSADTIRHGFVLSHGFSFLGCYCHYYFILLSSLSILVIFSMSRGM